MSPHDSQSAADDRRPFAPLSPRSEEDQYQLALELRRVRAEAAKLEARGAELELQLLEAAGREPPLRIVPPVPQLPVDDWEELLHASGLLEQAARSSDADKPAADKPAADKPAAARSTRAKKSPVARSGASGNPSRSGASGNRSRSRGGDPRRSGSSGRPPQPGTAATAPAVPTAAGRSKATPAAPSATRLAGSAAAVTPAGPGPRRPRRSRRPAAWLVSTLAHAAVLMLLAAMTVSMADPRDQISLQASSVQPNQERIETAVFEQLDQPQETSSPVPLAELSPLGTDLGSDLEVVPPDFPPPASPALEVLAEGLTAGGILTASPSAAASQFFGAEGGGNHFVYLVDNSGSMSTIARDGFDIARRELLQSIKALHEDQRFYVIFFGEQVLRMRISDPAAPEPRSVYATDANKAALRRWVMGVQTQPGRWPEQALEFAFQLRPDAIFLLTDGEMSQRVEPMIRQHNLVENLFDGPRPRSIIHTIGFHSRSGEDQLRQIAEVNGGTYQFVPPPPR